MRGVRALIRRDACQPSHHHHHHRALATVAAAAASTTSTSSSSSSVSSSSSTSSSSSPYSVLRHHHSTKAAAANVAAGGEGGEGGSACGNQRQGTRTGVRPKGAPFRGTRGDNGQGWYKLYKEEGPEGFVKYRPPTPFNWSKPPTSPSSSSSPSSSPVPKRKKAFLDISLDKEPLGKIIIELANDLLPLTSENFLLLCQGLGREGGRAGTAAATLGYKGSKIHRIVKGAGIVGGDLSTSTSSSLPASSEKPRRKERGEGNHSALGARFFHDEGFVIPHSAPGLVSMVSAGVHRNGSHFYISTEACPHLDGRSVVFGRVVGGMEVVEKVAGTYSIRGRPVASVRVEEAGVVEE